MAMTEEPVASAAGAGIEAFGAYITAVDDSGVPPAQSAAAHARRNADVLAEDLARQEKKAADHKASLEARLVVLRADLARAQTIEVSDSASEFPQLVEVLKVIRTREAGAAAALEQIEAKLATAREAADAAEQEARRLEQNATEET